MNWHLLNIRPVRPESKQEKNLNAKKLPIEYGRIVNLNLLTIFKKAPSYMFDWVLNMPLMS